MVRIAFLALLLAGCTTPGHDPSRDGNPDSERAEEGVRRMQDEFNSLFPDG